MTDEIAANSPRILHKGVYTLYEKPDGTLRIQYRRSDKEEDDHLELPGALLRMAKQMSEGKLNPLKAIAAIKAGTLK